MPPLKVNIKHAGKTHDVTLNTDQPASVFKDVVYQLTGVPTDRMKVMIKGGVLKVSVESCYRRIYGTNGVFGRMIQIGRRLDRRR